MRGTILLLETDGYDLTDLHDAFVIETAGTWRVLRVQCEDELATADDGEPEHRVAILPRPLDDTSDGGKLRTSITQLQEIMPETPIVVVAPQGDVDVARHAIQCGAADFLVLGARLGPRISTLMGKLDRLLRVIDRNRQLDENNARLRAELQERFTIIGRSPQIKQLLDRIHRIASVPRPVLIVGERGTGKESVARAIHYAAGDTARPLVTVNCAAFNDSLLESELFGHEKGAFTGAESQRRGKFEQADGGTLFLDEIGHMSPAFQQKILRVVEYGVLSRVGGSEEQSIRVRIIAATNRNLQERIAQGEFLADLYDRLAFETIELPPLRKRKGDIAVLAQHFLDRFAAEEATFAGKEFSAASLAALRRYSFPGNVRELKNIVERAAYRDTTNEITPSDLALPIDEELRGAAGSFRAKVDSFSRRLLEDALTASGGNQAAAARHLGLSYHQFRYYAKKLEPEGMG
ncbi:MAG: sigma-54-dependent Fis family transcriptional regulator [Planctomycetales bacterium]|nr:sigma-54-dependent Fis family transcriptional regulator [Planctomycetales bacterium]